MASGQKAGDLGHIYSGDQLRWHFNCDGCKETFDGRGARKAAVIRHARAHLAANPGHGSGILTAVVSQSIRAVAR